MHAFIDDVETNCRRGNKLPADGGGSYECSFAPKILDDVETNCRAPPKSGCSAVRVNRWRFWKPLREKRNRRATGGAVRHPLLLGGFSFPSAVSKTANGSREPPSNHFLGELGNLFPRRQEFWVRTSIRTSPPRRPAICFHVGNLFPRRQ